ncbi:Chitin-inducible gibberellin-responsive protein 1 [Platanthera guangdongensis]|uniref:Chitin-inducible gibberellin-responsive protein 1 n=1 Tax=Platanthera guangdongensis TaxID=2320717 RepID=A0ABR2MWS5_9ASPA
MPYEFSCTPTSFSDLWAMVSLKFDLGSSPNSPLTSSQFDSDSSLPLTCSQFYYALQEIETALMAPDTAESITSSAPDPQTSSQNNLATIQTPRTWPPSPRPEKRHKEKRESSSVLEHVTHLLTICAEALADERIPDFDSLVAEIRRHVSITGHPIQRLGAYMLEGLVARHQASGSNIYLALSCRRPESKELMSYMRILYDVCPYFKFGYIAANGAIAEAVKNEDQIHIIDFQIAQGTQWVTLVQALAARPGGPPNLRITGIDDPLSEYARGDGLRLVGSMLSDLSKKFSIPIEFNALPVYAPEVTREMLDVRRGEAIVVSLTLVLHHTADESVDVSNPRDGLLRMIKGLSPKVTTLVEQESNTNTASFLMRFAETMEYYSAMFESIDVTLPRESRERINVEQHCLAKDIVNVIACEGKERIERHELLGKWRSRFAMAGFKPFPLSSHVNSVIRILLGKYSDKYSLVERDGAMLLGWKNRNLISASAWQ